MAHSNKKLFQLLRNLDLGASVAESDTLLGSARIETSAFADLFGDRVDLIPGTKGSGKSALFRIFVDFLPDALLTQKRVVVAHGIQAPGDPVFHAFTERFSKLTEDEFVSFWCIYLVSLANEHFIKGPRYRGLLKDAAAEVRSFQNACANARIPNIEAKRSLREILEWSLHVLSSWRPRFKYAPPGETGEFELDLFGTRLDGESSTSEVVPDGSLPIYVNQIKDKLEAVLDASGLSLWLMVDRLDEIFPRRSDVERSALRGLLRAMRFFTAGNIRVKVFLRDDMLEQIVQHAEGFTALTHVTVRSADTLRWTEDQILAMVVKRFFADDALSEHFEVSDAQLEASSSYRDSAFKKIFPPAVFRGSRQSTTIRWIFNHCADGRGVVTPRDVLDLLIRAKQFQQDRYGADQDGSSENLISAAAIQYGFEELSRRKRETYLQAEFPHLWLQIEKFSGGKTDYTYSAVSNLLGAGWKSTVEDLLAIGFLSKRRKENEEVLSIPFLYRHGMGLTQGQA